MTIKYTRWLRSYVGHQRIMRVRACAFIADNLGQVLLGRRADVMLWDVPGGSVELNETPATTVVREIANETGLQVAPVRLIGVYSGPDCEWTYPNGDQVEMTVVFLGCRILSGVLAAASGENLSLAFFPSHGLPSLLPRTARMLDDALAGREGHFD
jgi:8-oxo-dGTP pyrophosphatase MutT (NUDIX family)